MQATFTRSLAPKADRGTYRNGATAAPAAAVLRNRRRVMAEFIWFAFNKFPTIQAWPVRADARRDLENRDWYRLGANGQCLRLRCLRLPIASANRQAGRPRSRTSGAIVP